jgi:hypothetical protein
MKNVLILTYKSTTIQTHYLFIFFILIITTWKKKFNYSFFFFFGGFRFELKSFLLAKQILYHLGNTSGPFCSGYFGDGVSQTICLSWPPTMSLPVSDSHVVRIIDMSHWCAWWNIILTFSFLPNQIEFKYYESRVGGIFSLQISSRWFLILFKFLDIYFNFFLFLFMDN